MTGGVLVRLEERLGAWGIYWSDTLDLADERLFASIEEAGPVMRQLMMQSPPGLKVIKGGKPKPLPAK